MSNQLVSNQLAALEPPFDDEVASVLSRYPQQDGYVLGLFRTFANSLRFLKKGVPNLLDKESPLPLRAREIVILRVTANKSCEYEWGVHASIFANTAKLTPQQVTGTCQRHIDDNIWSLEEGNLLRAVDELSDTGKMQEQTLRTFQAAWTKEQQLEIFALCGTYSTISYVANHAALPLEPFAARFPI
jgi:alkylhydroperoxidase family enzyme